jgi:hypothetical protein
VTTTRKNYRAYLSLDFYRLCCRSGGMGSSAYLGARFRTFAMSKTVLRIAVSVGAAVYLARVVFSRSGRRKLEATLHALEDAAVVRSSSSQG